MEHFIDGWLWLLSIGITAGGVFAVLALIKYHYFKDEINEEKAMKGNWSNQPHDLDD